METRTCIHPFFLPSPHCTTPAVSHHLSSSAIAGLSLRHQLRFFLASAFFWKHLDLLHHTYILSLSDFKKRTRRRLFFDCCGFLKSKGASEAPLKPSVPFPCSLLDAIERRLWFCSFKAHEYCSIPLLSQEEASLAYFLMNRLVSGGPRTKWRFGFCLRSHRLLRSRFSNCIFTGSNPATEIAYWTEVISIVKFLDCCTGVEEDFL